MALYASIGALLCVSWLVFFRYLSHHPPLLHKNVDPAFCIQETTRAWAGIIGYVLAGVLGCLVTPGIALVIFLALPIFYINRRRIRDVAQAPDGAVLLLVDGEKGELLRLTPAAQAAR